MANTNSGRVVKKIKIGANVAIIIVALATVLVLAKSYLVKPKAPRPEIVAGLKLDAEQIDWNKNQKNVVLVLSTNCHFCKESSGFYRKLVQQCHSRHIRTIAFFPQTTEEGQTYLKAEEVPVDEVRHADFRNLRVTGTPTLLLVDGSGVVQRAWFGKLADDKEQEVLTQSLS